MKGFIQASFIFIFLNFAGFRLFCADTSDLYSKISKAFELFTYKNEGESAFRSLLIPAGGRFEGLGTAFTALSNDISFFEANPAGSAFLKNTEIGAAHNNWIADAKLESFAYSQRTDKYGWGAALRCFYIPFTEYGSEGEKKASGFYSETFLIGNFSYNFFSRYDFKGITLGANIKAGITAVPPFSGQNADSSTKAQRRKNARDQNAYALLGDFGIILRANIFKKFYDTEPNFHFGIALKNFGVPIRGDVPPAYVSAGFSYRPVSIFLFSADVNQNVNLKNLKASGLPTFSTGMAFSITQYFNLLTGVAIRGGNPRFTLGGEVNLANMQINANYTLDLTNQIANFNKISVSVKLQLGDRGRGERADKIKKRYFEGLKEFKDKNYQKAITIWTEVLKEDPTFDPAKEGIKIAENQQKMQEDLRRILLLE